MIFIYFNSQVYYHSTTYLFSYTYKRSILSVLNRLDFCFAGTNLYCFISIVINTVAGFLKVGKVSRTALFLNSKKFDFRKLNNTHNFIDRTKYLCFIFLNLLVRLLTDMYSLAIWYANIFCIQFYWYLYY